MLKTGPNSYCVDDNEVKCEENCPLFTVKEVAEAVLSMENKNALGPDSVQIHKLEFYHWSELLFVAFNACLNKDIFHRQ